jgi:hypothetical protein
MDRCEGTFLYLSTRFDVALTVSKPNGVRREHPKWYFWNIFTGICMQIFPLNSQILPNWFVSSYGFNDERGKKKIQTTENLNLYFKSDLKKVFDFL